MSTSLAVAAQARDHWPEIIGEPALIMQRENAVFKVETSGGLAALRIHRPLYHQKSEISSELAWMAHLAKAGVKVPLPIPTRHGGLLAEITGDAGQAYIVDLLSWMEGQALGRSRVPLSYSGQELHQIFTDVGRNLARLHQLSDEWVRPDDFHRHALDKEGFLGERAAWGPFWSASVLSPAERELMQNVRRLAGQKLDALAAQGADYGLIHADLVRENIFVNNGKASFIDFDDSGFGFRMFDFAVALVRNREEPHYQIMKSALFAGYASQRPISPADADSLDLFLALRDFAYLGWADARRGEPSMAPRIAQIKQDTLAAAEAFLGRK